MNTATSPAADHAFEMLVFGNCRFVFGIYWGGYANMYGPIMWGGLISARLNTAQIAATALKKPKPCFCMGPNDEIESLRYQFLVQAMTDPEFLHKTEGMSEQLRRWLIAGEHSDPARAMFSHLTGHNISTHGMPHPKNLYEFWHCCLLLETAPELRPKLSRMAAVSRQWGQVVQAWDGIVAQLDDASQIWRLTAPDSRCTAAQKLLIESIK